QDSIYEFLVHTLSDSNDSGYNWSHLKISAHPNNPFRFSESEVDSGYSVDNKRPSAPSNLGARVISEALQIYWSGIDDEDFDYYAIYKSGESGFDPSATDYFGVTTDTLFTDSEVGIDTIYYYILSAFDFNGNESEYSPEFNASIVSAEDELILPDEYSLGQNYPNPFNPQTTISFALPVAGKISLIIYDLNGREIMRWDEEISQGGYYQRVWNGENLSGEQVSSGVYFYRFRAGDFVQTKKMVLLR
ncbi:MAG: T9SS type A sorting domain-containing protein, partial [Candidatus Marinimicrobia bacterium]|nr:T9SS type A sorting domain-containing protein [Candidatus Neomarinimicrobiota bacterium]